MGPIVANEGSDAERKRVIKWIDNNEEPTQGPKLVTSKSSDDLNCKENVEPIKNHHKQVELKGCIKKFAVDIN